jgi:hypothetical protein
MPNTKQLLILGDNIFSDKKYRQEEQLKRSTKYIFLIRIDKKYRQEEQLKRSTKYIFLIRNEIYSVISK